MWKYHAIYESWPCSVIIIFGKQQYRILEVVEKTTVSLVLSKQWRKVIAQIGKCFIFMIHSESEKNVAATTMTSPYDISTQQNQVEKLWKNTWISSPHPSNYLCIYK